MRGNLILIFFLKGWLGIGQGPELRLVMALPLIYDKQWVLRGCREWGSMGLLSQSTCPIPYIRVNSFLINWARLQPAVPGLTSWQWTPSQFLGLDSLIIVSFISLSDLFLSLSIKGGFWSQGIKRQYPERHELFLEKMERDWENWALLIRSSPSAGFESRKVCQPATPFHYILLDQRYAYLWEASSLQITTRDSTASNSNILLTS